MNAYAIHTCVADNEQAFAISPFVFIRTDLKQGVGLLLPAVRLHSAAQQAKQSQPSIYMYTCHIDAL